MLHLRFLRFSGYYELESSIPYLDNIEKTLHSSLPRGGGQSDISL